MKWIRNHGTLKFTSTHINAVLFETWETFKMDYVLVETWEYFKLSSTKIIQEIFKRTHLPPLSPMEKGTNHQSCLEATKIPNGQKMDEI